MEKGGQVGEGVIVPIIKKGEGERVEEYRRVTMTQTEYKVYVVILAEKLWGEIESKRLIPPSQTGFRKGLGTMDDIYVINYLLNRQVNRKEGKIILFIDLKAAFESVDRKVLVEAVKRREVREGLVRSCEEVLRETVSMVERVSEKEKERF